MQEYEFHALANVLPLMEGQDFENLAQDIDANGLREPIWLLDGKILDGRNRYRACSTLRKGVDVREYTGDDPAAFVMSLNLHRRHLTDSQRAMAAGKLANLRRGDNQHTQICGTSVKEAATLMQVSPRSVDSARTVQDKGVPELAKAVEKGDMSVSRAAEIAKEEPEVQEQIIQLPTASEARKIAKETGRWVAGRDGNLHDGRTLEQVRRDGDQMTTVMTVVNSLRDMNRIGQTISPEQFAALPYTAIMKKTINENFGALDWAAEVRNHWQPQIKERDDEGIKLASSN